MAQTNINALNKKYDHIIEANGYKYIQLVYFLIPKHLAHDPYLILLCVVCGGVGQDKTAGDPLPYYS